MRYLIALAPLALLAACGGNKAAGNNAATAATTNAATPAPAPVTPPVTMAPGADPRRAGMLAGCSEAVAKATPAGTDVGALCSCAVERVLGGEGEEPATMACAAQMSVTIDRKAI